MRAYGLGLAAGGLSVAGWLWITSLLEIGPRPTGIAARNPGAVDTLPHGVTIVGMILSVVLVLIAVIAALVSRLAAASATSPRGVTRFTPRRNQTVPASAHLRRYGTDRSARAVRRESPMEMGSGKRTNECE